MQDQKVGAQRQRAFDLAAKSGDGLGVEFRIAARHVDQVVGMNYQRAESVALAQACHLVALRASELVWLPLPRARRKYLKGIAAQPVGPFGSVLDAAGS